MRRSNSPFSLSLLDLLTAALGAVIFLFIITPKGENTVLAQASVYIDTTSMQIHGTLPDSLLTNPGQPFYALVKDFRSISEDNQANLEAQLAAERRRAQAAEQGAEEAQKQKERALARTRKAEAERIAAINKAKKTSTASTKPSTSITPEVKKSTTKEQVVKASDVSYGSKKSQPNYAGTPPSVPARLSFELKWADKNDNVDLFVCQGKNCVFGNRKRDAQIGAWDSGKSRNRIFGNDLRTNQEAVRQFDKLLPGTYTIYAMFKKSAKNRPSVQVEGLIYTKNDKGQTRGETYKKTLKLSQERTRLITVDIRPDGSFETR